MPKKILPVASGADWLTAREHGLGGSEVAAIMGRSPWATPTHVWKSKRGLAEPKADNEDMEWGRRLEPLVAMKFAEETGLHVDERPCGLWQDQDRPWMLASPDRFYVGNSRRAGILEIKTTDSRFLGDWDNGPPEHHKIQLNWYLGMFNYPEGYVALLAGGKRYSSYVVPFDPALFDECVQTAEIFWNDCVIGGTPPEIDPAHRLTSTLLDEMTEYDPQPIELPTSIGIEIEHYKELKRWEKAVAADIEHSKNVIRMALGPHCTGTIDGREVIRYTPFHQSRVSPDLVRSLYPELVSEVSIPITGRRMTLPTEREEN